MSKHALRFRRVQPSRHDIRAEITARELEQEVLQEPFCQHCGSEKHISDHCGNIYFFDGERWDDGTTQPLPIVGERREVDFFSSLYLDDSGWTTDDEEINPDDYNGIRFAQV